MLGAIMGDIVGSRHEFKSTHNKNFELLDLNKNRYTDDTVMTVAVARATMEFLRLCPEQCIYTTNIVKVSTEMKYNMYRVLVIKYMKHYGAVFDYAGYGSKFRRWLFSDNINPYNSFGNGSAMRVSSVGWLFSDLNNALEFAKLSAEVTHNHPEGIRGAQATVHAIWLARNNYTKDDIKAAIESTYGYDLNRTVDDIINSGYKFNSTCQGSVPEAIIAFLESNSYEDAIRNAVRLGGDADTQAAIAGSIAEAFYYPDHSFIDVASNTYGIPAFLDRSLINVVYDFYNTLGSMNANI